MFGMTWRAHVQLLLHAIPSRGLQQIATDTLLLLLGLVNERMAWSADVLVVF